MGFCCWLGMARVGGGAVRGSAWLGWGPAVGGLEVVGFGLGAWFKVRWGGGGSGRLVVLVVEGGTDGGGLIFARV